ncbi:MAG: aspartate/glutamate racemase [Paraglaciecola sp.]|jgi:aspartate/glutamate racemase
MEGDNTEYQYVSHWKNSHIGFKSTYAIQANIIENLTQKGAQGIILGCTEIGLTGLLVRKIIKLHVILK